MTEQTQPDSQQRGRSGWRERRRASRLRRAEEKLADAVHHFDTWVWPFHERLGSIRPSQMRREYRTLEEARACVLELGGSAENRDCERVQYLLEIRDV